MPNTQKTYCSYQLGKIGEHNPCGKPTKYKTVKDDDNTVRDYDNFCPNHRIIVDNQKDEDE